MKHTSFKESTAFKKKVDTLAIFVFEAQKSQLKKCPSFLDALSPEFAAQAWGYAIADGFTGKSGEGFSLHSHGKFAAKRLLLIGLGKEAELKSDHFRIAGGKVTTLKGKKSKKVAIVVPEQNQVAAELSVQAAIEGVLLADYRFEKYKSEASPVEKISELSIAGAGLSTAKINEFSTKAAIISSGVSMARDLVNECPGILNPIEFAKRATQVAKDSDLKIQVLDEKALKKEKMGLMLAVAQAAMPYTPPRLVKLSYKPAKKAKKHLSLVGKGLTFDCGGLDLKPAAGMLDMKLDMGGAAAVLGAMLAIGQLKPDVAVTGYLVCVENGIGGNAYHPSDILVSRKGLTVEVNNTDAEGRLVLADAIDYTLSKDKPDVLIDLATLTGACMVALGPVTSAVMSRDADLVSGIREAGATAGEDFWQLPLNKELNYQLKSSIADTKNTGLRYGGAITAGLFLEKFVDDRATWAHLDIAGPVMTDRPLPYTPKGASGFAVRTLVNYAENMS